MQRGQLQDDDPELVRDVLHRLLAFCERAGDHEHVVATALLFAGEQQDVACRAADVQPCDHVHDRQSFGGHVAGSGARRVGAAATTPSVSQKMAVMGAPPKSAAPASAPTMLANHASGT